MNGDELLHILQEVAEMRGRLVSVEEGVANFRKFQYEMREHRDAVREFIATHKESEKNREHIDKRRAHIHFALLSGLITLVAGCAIALFTWILNGHHTVVETTNPRQARTHMPQDAANPPY